MIKQPQKCFTYGQYCQKIETVLVTVSKFEKGDAHDNLLRPSNKIAIINLVILGCYFILTHYWVKNKNENNNHIEKFKAQRSPNKTTRISNSNEKGIRTS